MAVKLGKYKPGKEIPYAELVSGKEPRAIIEAIAPGFAKNLTDVRFITPEEYEREYGGNAVST